MPLPIENREPASSIRNKINSSFTEIASNTSSVTTLQSQVASLNSKLISREFETVAELLEDTAPSISYSVGDYFRVLSGNFIYQVAASGATDHHVTTAGGVKLYVLPGEAGYSVKAFGAVGDGVTNDAAAFNAAISALNADDNPAVLNLDRGVYSITGSLNPITRRRKVIDGYGATINHDAGTLFSFGVGGSVCVVRGLQYNVPATPTAGTCFLSFEGANACVVRDITARVNIFANIGLSTFVGGYLFENINISTFNGTQTIIDHGSGAVSQMNNIVMTAVGTNRVLDETTLTNATATGIRFSGAWDTGIWSGLLLNGYRYGLDVNRTVPNVSISNFRVVNAYFDFCAEGIRLKNTALGGGINNWYFSNCWVAGMDGYGVFVDGGTFQNVIFSNVQSLTAGKNNWRLNAGALSSVTLQNCVGQFANRLNATNVGADRDDFVATNGNFQVFNSRFGQSANNVVASGVPNWQGRYGMNITGTFGPYLFEGNRLEGSLASSSVNVATATPAGSARSCSVTNNYTADGGSAVSYATVGVVTAPTSGALQTNLTPLTMRMYVFGGTITQVQHNGIQICGANGGSFILRPGETWQVNYSVAPTITRVVMP